jgi:His/Glu/Gln/Arg/opine family amino acid ABC transporter permease subunit
VGLDWKVMLENFPVLGEGLRLTVILSASAMCLGMAFGALLTAMGRSGFRLLSQSVRVYVELILGLPVLVLMYIIFFMLPEFGILIDPVAAGLLTLTLYYSPYISEVMRGGLNAIPTGQIEAGKVVGMSNVQVMSRVLVPQAVGLMLPPLTGLFIGLVKDSALLSIISVHEFTFEAKEVVSRTYAPFEVYVVVAAGYWLLNNALEIALRSLEHRMNRYRAT